MLRHSATRAARGARQLAPRARLLSAFRDAYLVGSSVHRRWGFTALGGLIRARTRSRSTAAARAPPPRVESRRIAPRLPKTDGRERRAVAATEARRFLGRRPPPETRRRRDRSTAHRRPQNAGPRRRARADRHRPETSRRRADRGARRAAQDARGPARVPFRAPQGARPAGRRRGGVRQSLVLGGSRERRCKEPVGRREGGHALVRHDAGRL